MTTNDEILARLKSSIANTKLLQDEMRAASAALDDAETLAEDQPEGAEPNTIGETRPSL